MIEDKPLARSLYSATEVERPIPAEFYRAVADEKGLHERAKVERLATALASARVGRPSRAR